MTRTLGRHFPYAAAGLAALAIAGCSTSTSMLHTWAAPDFQKTSIKKLLVMGIAKDGATRRTFEDAFVARLKELGYEAVPGYLWAPDATTINRDAVAEKIRSEHVTHVIVTRVASVRDVQSYVPGTVYAPGAYAYGPAYYGGWYSYYSYGYTAVVTPGYTVTNQVVTLETNLYYMSRPENDAIVWSGTSETWRGESPTSNVNSVITTLVYNMRNKNIL